MKETFYFQHDFNARNDPKLQSLLMEKGVAGIGVYWCIIEQLYEQGGVLSLAQCKSIAFALHIESKDVESVIRDFDLFQNDGENFWSESVNSCLSRRKEISEKRKSAAISSWKSRGQMQMQSNYNGNLDTCNAIKENKIKENINIITSDKSEVSGSTEPASGKNDEIDYQKIVNLYHELCPSFPRIIKISEARKAKMRIRFADEMKRDWNLLTSIFRAMESSKFLRGDNRNGWKATFDWIFENSKNWVKVAEGNYDERLVQKQKVNDIWPAQ